MLFRSPLEASTRATADAARSASDAAAAKVAGIQKTLDGLPGNTEGALKDGVQTLAKHPLSTLLGDTKAAVKLPSLSTIKSGLVEQATGAGRYLYAGNAGQTIGVAVNDAPSAYSESKDMFSPVPAGG